MNEDMSDLLRIASSDYRGAFMYFLDYMKYKEEANLNNASWNFCQSVEKSVKALLVQVGENYKGVHSIVEFVPLIMENEFVSGELKTLVSSYAYYFPTNPAQLRYRLGLISNINHVVKQAEFAFKLGVLLSGSERWCREDCKLQILTDAVESLSCKAKDFKMNLE